MFKTCSFHFAFIAMISVLMSMGSYACESDTNRQDTGSDGDLQENIEEDFEFEQEQEVDLLTALYGHLVPNSEMNVHNRLGVATHMDQGVGDNADRNFELAVYKNLGGFRIREDFSWSSIESSKGQWNFEGLDTQLALTRENNVKMIALLDYGVGWAQPDGTPNSIDPADFANFAANVAERYCKDIKDYEIWNEENIVRFWAPEPNPDHYTELLKASYAAIKQVCPDARVLFGGMASINIDQYMGKRWWFIEEAGLAHPDICSYFDVLGLHPYTYGQASSPEQDYELTATLPMQSQTEMVRIAREKLRQLGCSDKPLWFTEMGWPTYDLGEETVARFLSRSVLLSLKDDIQGYYWYDFYDGEPITSGMRPHENYFGLFGWPGDQTNPRREKPAFTSYKAINTLLGNSYFARDLSTTLALPDDVYVLAFVDPVNAVILALWDGRENPDGKFSDSFPNNPDTNYKLDLPLPEWTTNIVRYDQDGQTLETVEKTGDSLPMTLTAKVQYLSIGTIPLSTP